MSDRLVRRVSIHRAATLVVLAVLATLLVLACDDKPTVYDQYDSDEILDYIESREDGAEFFRTDSLIVTVPYTKPGNDSVFTDFVDSVVRHVDIVPTEDNVEKDFGSPYWIKDDAEAVVTDSFFVRIRRVLGDDTTFIEQVRRIVRRAYFLRVGNANQDFGGWLMIGFDGGHPRSQTVQFMKLQSGRSYNADAWDYRQIQYIQYKEITGDSVYIDTTRGYSEGYYRWLDSVPTVPRGQQLVFDGVNTDASTRYQLIGWKGENGYGARAMHGPDAERYLDTIITPSDSLQAYRIVVFQEFKFPDRLGAMWVVPYRVGN